MRININHCVIRFLSVAIFLFAGLNVQSQDAEAGAKIFKQKCSACHKLDKKLIGPPLNESLDNWDGDRAAMYQWVKNWQSAVDAGYPRAIEVQDYDPSAMNLFPELSDGDLDNIWAYIADPAAGGDKSVIVGGGDDPTPKTGFAAVNWLYVMLLVAAIILALVLAYVLQNIRRLVAEKEGKQLGKRVPFWQQIFNKKVMMALAMLAFILIGFTAYKSAANLGRTKGYAPEQPIAYSHKLHAGQLGIECQYCHTSAAIGKQATIPAVNVCMNCHKGVSEGTLTGTVEIQKIYDAAGFNPETQQYDLESTGPIEWVRMHNLPDHVYFNHSQHVSVGQIECQTCHGEIQDMEVVAQHSNLSMGWCIDCHRETKVQFEDNAYYSNLYEDYHEKLDSEDKKYKDFFVTVEKIGGTECQKCHY